MRQVTCTTKGCENEGIGIIIPADDSTVICGPCGAPISQETPID